MINEKQLKETLNKMNNNIQALQEALSAHQHTLDKNGDQVIKRIIEVIPDEYDVTVYDPCYNWEMDNIFEDPSKEEEKEETPKE